MADLAELNRKVFNDRAQNYEKGFEKSIKLLCEETRNNRLWISSKWTDTAGGRGQDIRLLEYACGPGYISRTLEPFVTECLGLDVSEGMIAAYNQQVQEAGISSEKMSAKVGDLLAEHVAQDLQEPKYHNFDIIVIGSALHHFRDPQLAMNRLSARLKKGGVLFIVEMVGDHDSEREHKHISPETAKTVHKHGFSVDEIKELYSKAGFGANIGVKILDRPLEMTVNGHDIVRTALFARGSKL